MVPPNEDATGEIFPFLRVDGLARVWRRFYAASDAASGSASRLSSACRSLGVAAVGWCDRAVAQTPALFLGKPMRCAKEFKECAGLITATPHVVGSVLSEEGHIFS